MSIRTKPSTDAFREGFDRINWKDDGSVDAPLEAEVARLAADSPPSSDGWSVPQNTEPFVMRECCLDAAGFHEFVERIGPEKLVEIAKEARRYLGPGRSLEVHGAKPDAIKKPGTGE